MYCLSTTGGSYTEVTCETPGSLVVLTRAELAQYSPFYMDTESAVAIGGAILMVMAVAFVIRMVVKSLAFETEGD